MAIGLQHQVRRTAPQEQYDAVHAAAWTSKAIRPRD